MVNDTAGLVEGYRETYPGLPIEDFLVVDVFQEGKFRPPEEIDAEVLGDPDA
jgi:hypothetical protein